MQGEEHIIIFFHIACQSTIRQGHREVPHARLMGKPGTAFLPHSARLIRKRVFPRLFYFDAQHEQTMRDRTQTLGGYASESSVEARTSESEESDTEWQSAHPTVTSLAPAAEADEDAADFNFGDAPRAGAPAAGQDESQ